MRLRIFPSGPGDCLLLTGKDGRSVLIDGGEEYRDRVAPELVGEKLDVVYVSHDDGDHIKGVLQLFEDMRDWKVFDFQRTQGNNRFEEPENPRPPEVEGVWHNAFSDLLPDDFKPVFEGVSNSLSILSASTPEQRSRVMAGGGEGKMTLAELMEEHAFFATSQKQSHELSRLIGRNLLKLEVNAPVEGGLIRVDEMPDPISLGGMSFRVLGPRAKDIDKLREIYQEWLDENSSKLDEIREESAKAEKLLRTGEDAELDASMLAQAVKLGRRSQVTPPNRASLMFWVEEDGKTIVLTGDGHHAAILESMEEQGLVAPEGHVHVDVLKIPHHGSEHNADETFFRRLTADHYVFCGNGAHHNPDPRLLDAFFASRLGGGGNPPAGPDRPFKVWFSAHRTTANTEIRQKHMKDVEEKVADLAKEHPDKFEARYLENLDAFLDVEL